MVHVLVKFEVYLLLSPNTLIIYLLQPSITTKCISISCCVSYFYRNKNYNLMWQIDGGATTTTKYVVLVTRISVKINCDLSLLSSLFIHGFLDTVLHFIRTIIGTVINVLFIISNSLSSVHLKSIHSSYQEILFLTLFYPISPSLYKCSFNCKVLS